MSGNPPPKLPQRRMFFGAIAALPVALYFYPRVFPPTRVMTIPNDLARQTRRVGHNILFFQAFAAAGAAIAYATRNPLFNE